MIRAEHTAANSYQLTLLWLFSLQATRKLAFWPAEVASSMVTADASCCASEPVFRTMCAKEEQGCSANLRLSLILLSSKTCCFTWVRPTNAISKVRLLGTPRSTASMAATYSAAYLSQMIRGNIPCVPSPAFLNVPSWYLLHSQTYHHLHQHKCHFGYIRNPAPPQRV
jgi:hypothetical protein